MSEWYELKFNEVEGMIAQLMRSVESLKNEVEILRSEIRNQDQNIDPILDQ